MTRGQTLTLAVSAILVGALVGWGSAAAILGDARLVGRQNVGGWTTNRLVGSTAADPYTRAIVAKRGLLALSKNEAMYFQRFADDEGQPLTEECSYRVEGGRIPVGWWGMTLYAEDDFLPRNGLGAYSIDATQVAGGAGGKWTATLSSDRAEGPWIATRGAGKFLLTLRLYQPSAPVVQDPSGLNLPSIKLLTCSEPSS